MNGGEGRPEVPFARPWFGGREVEAVSEVVASGWLTQGPRVEEFERAFADRVGAAEAVATTSCSTALQLALYASGVSRGDEVIVPSLSFIATANAVWQCGATPVFADVDPVTCNIDPAEVDRLVTARTTAVVPVHQVGLPADMDGIRNVAEWRGLTVVEDAACALGAAHRGRPIGSLGYPACFSFHPRKVITCGEGGMIALDDAEMASRLRALRQHAMDRSALARHRAEGVVIEHYPEPGWNARMTDIQAAIAMVQLASLDFVLDERRRIAERYSRTLSELEGVAVPAEVPYATRAWQSYPLRVLPDAPLSVHELMQRLKEDGIATRRGVMAIHLEDAYMGSAPFGLPHTEAALRETVLLPLFPGLTRADQDRVVERICTHVGAVLA